MLALLERDEPAWDGAGDVYKQNNRLPSTTALILIEKKRRKKERATETHTERFKRKTTVK